MQKPYLPAGVGDLATSLTDYCSISTRLDLQPLGDRAGTAGHIPFKLITSRILTDYIMNTAKMKPEISSCDHKNPMKRGTAGLCFQNAGRGRGGVRRGEKEQQQTSLLRTRHGNRKIADGRFGGTTRRTQDA